MHDPETQAALERIRDRQSWSTGWILGGIASLAVFIHIFRDWHTRNSTAKFSAVALILVLILLPIRLAVLRTKQRPISNGWLLTMAYVLLMLSLLTFTAR